MPKKRKHEGLELENGSSPKKLKTHEKDKSQLVSKQHGANTVVQPKSNKQPMKAVNDQVSYNSSNRVAKKERRKERKERKQHEKELIADVQKVDEEPLGSADVQGLRQKSKKANKERKKHAKASWKVSEIAGGRMLNLDPIFALNEEYVDCICGQLMHKY